MADISSVKVGDWLVIDHGFAAGNYDPADVGHKVAKITPKRAATAEGQYDLASGKGFGSDSFWRARIATSEEVVAIEAKVTHEVRCDTANRSTYQAYMSVRSVYKRDVPGYFLDACEALESARLRWVNERGAK